ncbi:MAG: integrase, partial [Nitrosomonas sp.]|nr:integrase [Nitrosomonas sp.]
FYGKYGHCLTDPAGNRLNQEELEALLTCLQIDADLSADNQVSAEILRQTYILYLVRQGIRLGDLESVTGYISPTELSGYGTYAPAGTRYPVESVNLFYPIDYYKQDA